MRIEEHNWVSEDGKKIQAQSWLAEKPSGKIILLIHGLGEHQQRYQRWIEMLNAEGHSVLSYDQRGHGKSDGKRGHAPSIEVLLDDMEFLYKLSDTLFPGEKKILYGHSMGGNLALNFIIRRNLPVAGLIVTSPWLKLFKPPEAPILTLSRILKKIAPALSLSNNLKPEQISRDPEVVRNYRIDPLIHDRISIKLFCELYDGGLFALNNIYKINCPTLIMHGSGDTITSHKASEAYAMNTNRKIQFRLWEDRFHELHHELNYKEVFEFTADWIRKYI
jgi:acylglycerol lipase